MKKEKAFDGSINYKYCKQRVKLSIWKWLIMCHGNGQFDAVPALRLKEMERREREWEGEKEMERAYNLW